MDLELRMWLALVAFDQYQIDWRKLAEQRRERRLGLAPQLAHQSKAAAGGDQHLGGPGHPVRVGVFAGLIDVELVMRVLERRHRKPARDQARDRLAEERGLARAAVAREADDAHAALYSNRHAVC